MTQYFNQPDHKRARQSARGAMPQAEALLWSKLNGRKLLGCKFRHQYGIESYRLDFYSPELMLGIELDGETHFVDVANDYDRRRQPFIEALGIRLLRILNSDVYENLDGVWEAIARAAREQIARLGADVPRGRRTTREGRRQVTSGATPPAPPS